MPCCFSVFLELGIVKAFFEQRQQKEAAGVRWVGPEAGCIWFYVMFRFIQAVHMIRISAVARKNFPCRLVFYCVFHCIECKVYHTEHHMHNSTTVQLLNFVACDSVYF